jgi:hypothetical protein
MSIELPIVTRVSGYHSFLLRLWQEEADTPWRASLQNVQTGAVVRFASLDALIAFLQEQAIDTASTAVSVDDSRPPVTTLSTSSNQSGGL